MALRYCSCVFVSLGNTSHFYAPLYYARTIWAFAFHPGLEPLASEPLLVPQWRQSQHADLPVVNLANLLTWSGCKGGRLPSAHRHAACGASKPCSWTVSGQAQKLNVERTFSLAGRLDATQPPHSLPSLSKGGLPRQHWHHHSEHFQRKQFLSTQEFKSLLDRISK